VKALAEDELGRTTRRAPARVDLARHCPPGFGRSNTGLASSSPSSTSSTARRLCQSLVAPRPYALSAARRVYDRAAWLAN
jgi:hypothetical protein